VKLMNNPVNEFTDARILFDLFCDARDWSWESFSTNPKNKNQYLAKCFDQKEGIEYNFLITKSGKYYRLLGNKQWEPYEYVLNPVDTGGR